MAETFVGFSGPTSFGSGDVLLSPVVAAEDCIAIDASVGALVLPQGYVSRRFSIVHLDL